jgi:pre-60S factor REI1
MYYDQNFRPVTDRKPVDDKVKRVREKLADPTQALVPVAGGSGGFGRGLQVMKARNAGEAKWAKKQGRSFNEQRRRTEHQTRVGFVHNNQKRTSPRQFFPLSKGPQADNADFRDPLRE